MVMRHCKHDHFFVQNAIDNAERELSKDVSAATEEVQRPTFGRILDRRYRSLKFAFKIQRR